MRGGLPIARCARRERSVSGETKASGAPERPRAASWECLKIPEEDLRTEGESCQSEVHAKSNHGEGLACPKAAVPDVTVPSVADRSREFGEIRHVQRKGGLDRSPAGGGGVLGGAGGGWRTPRGSDGTGPASPEIPGTKSSPLPTNTQAITPFPPHPKRCGPTCGWGCRLHPISHCWVAHAKSRELDSRYVRLAPLPLSHWDSPQRSGRPGRKSGPTFPARASPPNALRNYGEGRDF